MKSCELVPANIEFSQVLNRAHRHKKFTSCNKHTITAEVVIAQIQFFQIPKETQILRQSTEIVRCQFQDTQFLEVTQLLDVRRGNAVV